MYRRISCAECVRKISFSFRLVGRVKAVGEDQCLAG